MRYPGIYGTNNQRMRIYRTGQLPYKRRSLIDIPVSLGDAALSGDTLSRYGAPAALGALIGALAGYGLLQGALVGAITGFVFPDFGGGLVGEVGPAIPPEVVTAADSMATVIDETVLA